MAGLTIFQPDAARQFSPEQNVALSRVALFEPQLPVPAPIVVTNVIVEQPSPPVQINISV